MGSISNKNYKILTCCSNRYINQNDFNLQEKNYIYKIIKIQSIIKGFLLRKKMGLQNDLLEKKEISLDYKTDIQENNPLILRLNNLLPKFELNEK